MQPGNDGFLSAKLSQAKRMERQQTLERIVHSALELDPSDRPSFIEQACAGDPLLKSEVESLILERERSSQGHSSAGRMIGHYKVVSLLGKGGMGEVYLAEDTRLGRKVALKLLPPQFTNDEERLRRFQQEARAVSALNHPNIITVYDIGHSDSGFYIATEFVEGETVRQHISKRILSISRALDIAIQAAGALASAHAAGIAHRDIKPENIMLRPDGYAKMLDFGLAKLTETQRESPDTSAPTRAQVDTQPGAVMGTAAYMSPEQARGQVVDSRTDIFSLGAVIYEMIGGRAPFEGESNSDIIAAILYKEPPPLARYSREAPEELEWIVAKALRKDKEERYQTAKELLGDLKNLQRKLELEVERRRTSAPEEIPEGRVRTAVTTDEEVVAPSSETAPARATLPVTTARSAPLTFKGIAALALVAVAIVGAIMVFRMLKSAHRQVEVPIRQFTLNNGLRVILSEDHSSPTYSISVTYNVGSRDETPGRTGFAHLFEHMMFQGSENVGKGEHFILVETNGGQMNGNTYADRTVYFQTLPSNQLDLGLFLEADRMRSLAINQANLDNQRRAVQEERRLAVDNRPYGRSYESLIETAYDGSAYKHSPYGSTEDLDAATVEDVLQFFKVYYAPNNAVLTLVGDFDSEEALAKVRSHFEDIPGQPAPPPPDLNEPEQDGERRKTIEDSFAQAPSLDIAYKVAPGNTDDWYAIDVLSHILAGGQSSRLYQRLVKEKEVAAGVVGAVQERTGPSLALFNVTARPGKDLAEIEKLFYEEIERVKNESVADWEIEKVRVQLRRQRIQRLQSSLQRAVQLGQFAASYNDPTLLNEMWQRLARVGKAEVQRAAREYLKETNRTVINTLPAKDAQVARVRSEPAEQDSKAIPLGKVERKMRAPVSHEILTVKLPRAVESKLVNGLTLLIIEDHRFPVVNALFSIAGAGAVFEPAELPGLANVTAQMLREGTKSYTSKQLAEELERRGATLSTSSGFGSGAASVAATGLSDNFYEWFSLVCDVVLNPTFPVDELNSLKQRLKVQWQQQRSTPQFLADERLKRAVYGAHPAAVTSATPESISTISSELLARWHRERYSPQNTVLGIAGDVNADEVISEVNRLLGPWPKTELVETLPPNPTPAAVKRIHLVDRPGSIQTTLMVGNLAIDRRDADYVSLAVMNRVLGETPASRLFLNLREEKGYTYGVFSVFTALKFPGPWRAWTDVRTEVTDGAVRELMKEIRRMAEERVPEAELDDAKRSVFARFALSLEQPAELLGYALTRNIYGFSADYWDLYPKRIRGVSVDDVQRVARRYLNVDALQIVAVGDAGKIRSVLDKYGPVEVYDTDGRALSSPTAAASK
jgi:zinc protease